MSAQAIIQRRLGHSQAIIDGVAKAGIGLGLGCALVEQESGGDNIFGHDQGGLFPGEWVTAHKVKALIAHVEAGGVSNGVGLTQLTYIGYIQEAEKLGGAHVPRNQCRVGFQAIKDILDRYGEEGLWRYNGSTSYQAQIENKYRDWKKLLG